jgi:S-adenosylmethionine/arginine decarboxylase-like enzyme
MIEHKHIIIRAEVTQPPMHDELDSMREWFKNMITEIGMKILKGPYLTYLDKSGNRGFTGVAIIETSHIALHVWDEDNPAIMQLDVYTCGSLDPNIVISNMKEFSPIKIEYVVLDREYKIEIKENGVV